MSLAVVTLALLLRPGLVPQETQQQPEKIGVMTITRPNELKPVFQLQTNVEPMEPGHMSPKKFGVDKIPWEFPWWTFGYGYPLGGQQLVLRFRVYSQDRKAVNDKAAPTTRMLLTLWDEVKTRMGYDHADHYEGGIVEAFLCWGGKPGGEQRFDLVFEGSKHEEKAVNTIYFYDLPSFTEPVEMAREVAHEYGHAVLPAVGGFTEPESWANGYLGEKLFLRWIWQGMVAGKLLPDDAMGATQAQIGKWVEANVDPLVLRGGQTFPSQTLLKATTAAGMNSYIGLALFAETVLPDFVFGRSMRLIGSTDAWDYPEALLLAAEEPDQYTITIPKLLAGKPIWIPLGKGKLTGGKILKFQDRWAQIEAPEGKLTVENRRA